MFELPHDFAEEWFLDLWSRAPTLAKAARLRESTIGPNFKAYRIRRWHAAEVARILKQPPSSVAPGVTEAASAHIPAVIAASSWSISSSRTAHPGSTSYATSSSRPRKTSRGSTVSSVRW
jgi:hypothetical protein